ncbi:dihydroorotase [Bacteroides sp. 519]|uniref:dihydroorotase n=1 Tax=Bacteroides sp. 519 TaxID=2302937 RepID=UPI0013D3C36D|nr:dihydroorotase [Bacteroides sp. 519]NDV60107.1 dihydroorotase [Bacteroides sp. 519]
MIRTLISNACIVNEGKQFQGSIVIENEVIKEILPAGQQPITPCHETIDATGLYLLPGVIDEHVHFRDPGLTQKGDILSESWAAVAGGVTSVMDMPNTNPVTTSLDSLNMKFELMAEKSSVNYSCYFGATNNNYNVFGQLNPHRVCGVKLFMGSSTGNMLVDQMNSLQHIFNGTDLLIAAHCESQDIIKANTERYLAEAGVDNDLPLIYHPLIRSVEACYESSKLAVELAQKAGARLHIMHISTAKELSLFNNLPLHQKKITAEACVPHLVFTSDDYKTYGTRIKCNPTIKEATNREALQQAINTGIIDTIGTDHAPHLLNEKQGGALKATSGMPMIQFSLISMLNMVNEGLFTIEKVVEKMCHAPADLYQIHKRGYIREGYQADLVLVSPEQWRLETKDIKSKCGWSPLEGNTFAWKVDKTFVNGHKVYSNGDIDTHYRGQELAFRIENA